MTEKANIKRSSPIAIIDSEIIRPAKANPLGLFSNPMIEKIKPISHSIPARIGRPQNITANSDRINPLIPHALVSSLRRYV